MNFLGISPLYLVSLLLAFSNARVRRTRRRFADMAAKELKCVVGKPEGFKAKKPDRPSIASFFDGMLLPVFQLATLPFAARLSATVH